MKIQIFDRIILRLHRITDKRKAKYFLNRLKSYGDNVSIRQPVCFEGIDNISLGNDVSIAAFVHMWGQGGIKIGDRVMIGSHCALSTITHDYTEELMFNTVVSKPILIKDDVWIGTHAVILPGVTVGKGAVIGAGAIVTKNVPDYAVISGVPAVIKKFRL